MFYLIELQAMEQPTPFEQIAALRAERGETLAQFARTLGISSKGRLSEMEKGLVRPTVAQAIAIERLSSGRINAAALNTNVAASRASVIDDQSEDGSWADAIAHSPNMRVEEHSSERVIGSPVRLHLC
jgi:transcriptional regulator with XRE-family HTH domain